MHNRAGMTGSLFGDETGIHSSLGYVGSMEDGSWIRDGFGDRGTKMSDGTIYWTTLSALGRKWTLFATREGLCRIHFPHEPLESAVPWLLRHMAESVTFEERRSAFETFGALEAMAAYFRGERHAFDGVRTDLRGTSFQKAVWAELARIPFGEIRSYREVAEAIGRPRAVRAVGTANGANPLPLLYPCHRVVGSNRNGVGYRGGLSLKIELLKLEGVEGIGPTGHARFGF